jgi:hypothetical protein
MGSSPGSTRNPGIARKSIQAIQVQAPGALRSHIQELGLINHQISLLVLYFLRVLRVLCGEYLQQR